MFIALIACKVQSPVRGDMWDVAPDGALGN
jgi:hypothetical protein